MAERRMFAKTIVDSDAFLDMPATARLLYYDLAIRADDDGFINNPKKIMSFVGAKTDDMNVLISRKFIIPFDNGVVVIKHWRIHNYIRKDTYKETVYKEQMALLELDENKSYRLVDSARRRAVDEPSTQDRIGKDSIGKDSIEKEREVTNKAKVIPPLIEWVEEYINERGSNIDAQTFYDFYESKGWLVGKAKMKDWKACLRTWEKKDTNKPKGSRLDWLMEMEIDE